MSTRSQPTPDPNGQASNCPRCGSNRYAWELELPNQCLMCQEPSTDFVDFMGRLALEIVAERVARERVA